jgi:hypothetical protein
MFQFEKMFRENSGSGQNLILVCNGRFVGGLKLNLEYKINILKIYRQIWQNSIDILNVQRVDMTDATAILLQSSVPSDLKCESLVCWRDAEHTTCRFHVGTCQSQCSYMLPLPSFSFFWMTDTSKGIWT